MSLIDLTGPSRRGPLQHERPPALIGSMSFADGGYHIVG